MGWGPKSNFMDYKRNKKITFVSPLKAAQYLLSLCYLLRWPCYLTNKCCSSPTWTGLDVDLFKKKNRSITVIARLNFDPINTSTGSLKLQTQNHRKYKYRCNMSFDLWDIYCQFQEKQNYIKEMTLKQS